MIFVPMQRREALAPTRRSRELESRLEEQIRVFRREQPELTEAEVRAAVQRLAPPSDDDGIAPVRRRQVAALGVAAVAAIAGAVVATTRGTGGATGNAEAVVPVIAAVCVALAVVFVVVRFRARD